MSLHEIKNTELWNESDEAKSLMRRLISVYIMWWNDALYRMNANDWKKNISSNYDVSNKMLETMTSIKSIQCAWLFFLYTFVFETM